MVSQCIESQLKLAIHDAILDHDLSAEEIEHMFWVADDYATRAELTHKPKTFTEFVEEPGYLNSPNILYPEVLRCGEEMNCGDFTEAVLTGAIGTGKTTLALFSTAYQLYLLSCHINPHQLFDLDPSSEILFVFQSINSALAKAVDYERFKALINKSPYFMDNFPYQKDILSELRFPNRIIVKPVSGLETGAIGQNVIGGIIDEMNFMAVVQGSKASIDGAEFDQAMALYHSIARRRKSRFLLQGKMPGLLCLVSSKRYPGQFTDKKEEESQREIELTGKTSIYIYDKRLWDIKPEGQYGLDRLRVFIGDASRKPRVLEVKEVLPLVDDHLVREIPMEFQMEFDTDIMNALRDIAGISTLAQHPFITNQGAITKAMRPTRLMFANEVVDFVHTRLNIFAKQMYMPHLPRFVHIDLAVSGDSAGVCIGCVTAFKSMNRGDSIELMPDIWIDAALEVAPPKGGEIQLHKIREVLYALTKMGLNLKWVSFDQFQSVDSMQILKQAGYMVGRQSVDTTTAPYDFLKAALYDSRISIPKHAKLQKELVTLQKDTKKNKIDHPPHSSKDVSDALAGVVYGLTMRREIWVSNGIPTTAIPASIMAGLAKAKLAAAAVGAEENPMAN